MEMTRSHRNSLNRGKGKQHERSVVKSFQEAFPNHKFARVPDSRQFQYTNTKGDIIMPDDFPHRQIECRNRMFSQARDMRRFFEDFETSDYGKWFKECSKKFKGESWIIIFKIGKGKQYVICEEKLHGHIETISYIFNHDCYVYSLEDYIKLIKDDVKV